jgi:hypothetical protein
MNANANAQLDKAMGIARTADQVITCTGLNVRGIVAKRTVRIGIIKLMSYSRGTAAQPQIFQGLQTR